MHGANGICSIFSRVLYVEYNHPNGRPWTLGRSKTWPICLYVLYLFDCEVTNGCQQYLYRPTMHKRYGKHWEQSSWLISGRRISKNSKISRPPCGALLSVGECKKHKIWYCLQGVAFIESIYRLVADKQSIFATWRMCKSIKRISANKCVFVGCPYQLTWHALATAFHLTRFDCL